nr:insulin-like growth factor 1 receptor [Cherax quadricarinatus]
MTNILKGSVRIEKNWSLCPGPEATWSRLTSPSYVNVIQDNYEMCIYAQCEEDGNCTTRLSSLNTQCTYHGYCFQGEECHSECVGGCTCLHSATCCVACRHYQDGNTCLPACSPTSLNSVHHLGYRCVSEEWCRRSGWRVDQEYLVHDQEYLVHDQEYLVHDQEYLVHDTTKFILTCQGQSPQLIFFDKLDTCQFRLKFIIDFCLFFLVPKYKSSVIRKNIEKLFQITLWYVLLRCDLEAELSVVVMVT